MTKIISSFFAIVAITTAFVACDKSESVENKISKSPFEEYGWSCTVNSAKTYKSCISEATYTNTSEGKNLTIIGTPDASNCRVVISYTGSMTPGLYDASEGAYISFTSEEEEVYTTTATSFATRLNIITINDTLIEATFSGPVSVYGSNETVILTNGKVKALIGKASPCYR